MKSNRTPISAHPVPIPLDVDVIIIGTGAGGGTLARVLAGAGLKLLLLERGDFLRRTKSNWEPEAVFHQHVYHTGERWLDWKGMPFHPVTGYHVGGNTKLYGAAVLRRRERDFTALRHGGGETVPWPVRYADLAPFYDIAEEWYFAHGQRGEDPTEPPASGPFPYPPSVTNPPLNGFSSSCNHAACAPFTCHWRFTSMKHITPLAHVFAVTPVMDFRVWFRRRETPKTAPYGPHWRTPMYR